MLALNVHVDNWCEGCNFHTYPYESHQIPLSGEKSRVFTCDEDIWNVIELLIAETKEINENMGKSFDIAGSISHQLPFFSCMNIILSRQAQKDISQYLYCKEFSVVPFLGGYGQQPQRWINKVNIIKTAMAKREEREYKKAEQKAKANVGGQNG